MKPLLLLAAVAALASAVEAPPTPVPAGWRPVADPAADQSWTSPDGRLRLAVVRQDYDGQGEAAFAQACLQDLQRLLPDVVLTSWGFAELHHGRVWSRVRYRFRLGEQTVHQALWIRIDGTSAWCLTLGGTDEKVVQAAADRLEADLLGSRPVLR